MVNNIHRMDSLANLDPEEMRRVLDFDQNKKEAEEALRNMQSMAAIACDKHEAKEAFPMAACDHVCHQDKDKPDGIVYMPNNIVFCFTCLKLWEKKRIRFDRDIKVKCGACVMTEVRRIRVLNGNLVVDLRTDEFTGKR